MIYINLYLLGAAIWFVTMAGFAQSARFMDMVEEKGLDPKKAERIIYSLALSCIFWLPIMLYVSVVNFISLFKRKK